MPLTLNLGDCYHMFALPYFLWARPATRYLTNASFPTTSVILRSGGLCNKASSACSKIRGEVEQRSQQLRPSQFLASSLSAEAFVILSGLDEYLAMAVGRAQI